MTDATTQLEGQQEAANEAAPIAAKTNVVFFDKKPNLPLLTLEAAVQVSALLMRDSGGATPSGIYLLRKCGQKHVTATAEAGVAPDDLATWASAEAKRRSASLNHGEIVAQSLI